MTEEHVVLEAMSTGVLLPAQVTHVLMVGRRVFAWKTQRQVQVGKTYWY